MRRISKFAGFALAPLLLTSGLVALAAPAAQASTIGGDGSHSGTPGNPGSGSCNGCGGGGASGGPAHTSTYSGIAVFGANSRTNPGRGNPAPLGTYLNGTYGNGKSISADTTKEYNQDGQPCRASGGDTVRGAGGIVAYNLPVGVKWKHSIGWNNGATAATSSSIRFPGCVTSNQLTETVHLCPVRIENLRWDYVPNGTGAATRRSGTPVLSGSQASAFGTSFAQNFAGKSDQQKIDLVRGCAGMRTNYDYDPRSGAGDPRDLYGNYKVSANMVWTRCTTAVSADWVQEFSGSGNGWNQQTAKRKFNASEQWTGCSAPYTVVQENWLTFACVSGSPGVYRSNGGNDGPLDPRWASYDFGASTAACIDAPPPPVDCVYPTDAGVTFKVDGTPGTLRNGAVVTANGKKVRATWPTPQINIEGDPGDINIRDKKMTYKMSDTGAYPRLDDGTKPYDPMSSSVALDGGQAGWGVPLDWQFFKAASADGYRADAEVNPFTVTGTPRFTYDARVPFLSFNPSTGRIINSVVVTPTPGECPAVDATLFVAGSRNTN